MTNIFVVDATINAMRHRYNILATVIANFSAYL